jgi:hypothetical protein
MRTILFLGVILGNSPPLVAQTTLAWKFRAGDSFTVHQEIRQRTALEAKNKPFRQNSIFALQTRWHVKETDKGVTRIAVVVERCQSTVSTGDGKASVPSADDDKWRGAEFQLTVTAQGTVKDAKGREELLNKLAGGDPQRLKIVGALKPPESFQALFQEVLGPLPAKPAVHGDRWQHTAVEAMSIFGSFLQTTDFIYEGTQDGQESIRTVTKSVYQAPRYAVENDVIRVLKGEVQTNEAKGSLVFDADRGRMQQVRKSIQLRGDLTLETLNGTQRVTFTNATEMKIDVGK